MDKVIDSNSKVISVQRLQAVDANIFPIHVAVHPQICVYALAEKVAEMIAQSAAEVGA